MMMLQITGIVLMIIGIICVLYGVFVFSKERQPEQEASYLEKSILSSFGDKAEEIDKTIDEFDKVSGEVLTQLDEKYNELLFLYSLIDDKKQEVAGLSAHTPQITQKLSEFQELAQDGAAGKKFKNAKHGEVKRLIESGKSIADTAKELRIGQGEVRLILELGRMQEM